MHLGRYTYLTTVLQQVSINLEDLASLQKLRIWLYRENERISIVLC